MSAAMEARTSARPEPTDALLEQLRALLPRRALTRREAERVAELQAGRLLAALCICAPPVPDRAVRDLPFLAVTERHDLPASGLATRTASGWVIVLRADECAVRRRFSLFHELKHVLDDPLVERLYPATRAASARERAERVCDHFAACLLMPRAWIVRDWAGGHQDVDALARRYRVSRPAARIRLATLGLLPPTPRCSTRGGPT